MYGFTPISTVELDKVLRCYPKMDDAELLSFGFKYGFKLHYEGSRRLIETKNLKSVMQNPLAAKEKIENEIQNGRIAGPFSKRHIWSLRCSPVGIVPKIDFRLSINNSFIISTI
jgi:hypothetical protein